MKRQKELPKEFKIHINGTFNTRLAISYSMTIEDKYDEYQRKFYENKDLEKDYSIVIERFRNDEQALNEWLSGEAPLSKKPLFEKLQGKTRRDSSLFTVDVHKSIQLNHDELEKIKGKFVSPPILKELKLQYHENGIGVFSSFLEIHLKQSLSCNYNLFHNLVGTLGEATIKSPHLLETIKKIDEQIQIIATKLPSYRKKDKVTDIINLYTNPEINRHLWWHAMSILRGDQELEEDYHGLEERDKRYKEKLPYGAYTRDLLNVSHPKGLFDFNYFSKGFVHIGWGMSLIVGISQNRLDQLVSTHNKLQYYWRSIQRFNEAIVSILEKYTNLKTFKLVRVNESIDIIDKLKIEFELFAAHNMNYIENLHPFAYYIYKETCQSWRLNEMLDFCRNKLSSCSTLHKQGEDKIRSHKTNQLNLLISVLAILTLFSWAADSIEFLNQTDEVHHFYQVGMRIIFFITPIAVVVILILFSKIVYDMRKLE